VKRRSVYFMSFQNQPRRRVSGTTIIEPGDTSGMVTITVNGDLTEELPEAFLVFFANPDGASLGGFYGLGAGVIIDDD